MILFWEHQGGASTFVVAADTIGAVTASISITPAVKGVVEIGPAVDGNIEISPAVKGKV